MNEKKIGWGKEIAQAGSDAADLARDVGVPGIGLIARFAQHFYDKHLHERFERFVTTAEIDRDLIDRIVSKESYSSCFYSVLETVRQTHSRIGLIALALIYKDHWSEEAFLISAMQDFSQISDSTIEAFLVLYESIPEDKNYLELKIVKDGEGHFHHLYNEAVELIRRNFFVMSTGAGMHANGPVQGMKWEHTDAYYSYCKAARAYV